jgi:hypothetical protein
MREKPRNDFFTREKRPDLCERAKAPDDFFSATKLLMSMTFVATTFARRGPFRGDGLTMLVTPCRWDA